VLKYLDGYDITSEDNSKIEISFLFGDININLQKLLVRMVYMLKFSIKSYKSTDKNLVEENEMNMDRIYNLSKRILFSCMENSSLRTVNGIQHPEDLFFYKDVFKKLEQIGDNIYHLLNCGLSPNDLNIAKHMISLIEAMILNKSDSEKFNQNIRSIKIYSRKKEVKAILDKMQERCKDIYDNIISIEFNKRYF
jgi:hypothetical protein